VKKPNITATAKRLGVHRSTLQAWSKEGVNITDETALQDRLAAARKSPDETLAEAKRRRAVADADRAEITAQREAGKVIALDIVETAFAQVGAEFRSRLLAMRGSLVNELEGQTAENIYRILDQRFGELLTAIHKLSKP
jgi:transposase